MSEVEDAAALIDFVAVCRTYASELAINEVTLRTFSDLQHYVEQSTEGLVQSLRGGDARVRAFRQQQVKAAIRFCEVLFGHDYASLMNRAAENAVTGERKSYRAGKWYRIVRARADERHQGGATDGSQFRNNGSVGAELPDVSSRHSSTGQRRRHLCMGLFFDILPARASARKCRCWTAAETAPASQPDSDLRSIQQLSSCRARRR